MVTETVFKDKATTVKELVAWHVELDPEITEIYRFISENEESPDEPIKLLEVSNATFEADQVYAFGFSSTDEIPYKSVYATITPNEFLRVKTKELALPREWNLSTAQRIYHAA